MLGNLRSSTSVILRLEMHKELVTFGQIATTIGDGGGEIMAVDVSGSTKSTTTRDITVQVSDSDMINTIVDKLRGLPGVKVINASDQTFLVHLWRQNRNDSENANQKPRRFVTCLYAGSRPGMYGDSRIQQ
ncbi:ACT domain-containing protein [Paenibacillus tianmuensis]|uniref:ACT domain-containing protein n=1 Tax=Paenibacillus tianmuensis TaxID=624147 RepID=A0A1G4PMP9_9BACL|nr:ACT domain-containing protein [Paenibacillus tianmuensis]